MASAVVGALRVLLEANASQLESEFGKATIKIGEFDKFTQNAGRNLQRMVESFSGQKIVSEATKMAAAIEKVGGVSALTEKELRRVAFTVNEATEKMRAMGVAVPDSVAKLHAEIGHLGVRSTGTTGAVQGLTRALGLFGVGLSVAGVVQFGKQLLADADAAQKLSDKTGIAVESVQRLKFAAEQSGNTIDQVTSAISQMQNRLAEGDKSAVGALRQLGLSLENLVAMSPDQQFVEIARAVGQIENPMERTRLAMDLFGRSGAEILPTLRSDIKKLGDEAPVMSEKAVKAFDDFGDAVSRNWTRAKNAIGEGLATAIDGYSRLIDLSRALMTGDFARVPEVLFDLGTELPKIAAPANAMLKGVVENGKGVALTMDEIAKAGRDLDESFKKKTKSGQDYAKALDKASQEQRDFNNWIGERYVEAERQRQEAAEKSERQLRDFYNWLGMRRMEDDAALMRSTELLYGYTQAWVPFKAAVQSALAPVEDATQKSKRLAEAQRVLSGNLQNLAQAFAQLAQIAGTGGLGNALQTIGNLIGAMNLAHVAGQNIKDGLAQIDQVGGGVAAKFSLIAANAGVYVAAMARAASTTNAAVAAMSGFSSTAAFASGLGLTGAASIGAGIAGGVIAVAFAMENARRQAQMYRESLSRAKFEILDMRNALGAAAMAFPALNEEFNRLFNGPTTEATLKRMGDILAEMNKQIAVTNTEFAKLANQMLAVGGRLPASLQPYIQQLITLGVLTEDNIALFKQLTDGQEVDWRKMQEAAQRYGVNIDTLGKSFQQLRLGEVAEQMINDFELLKKGGADVGGVLFDMKDEIIALIKDSIKFGTTIPENMRPWIEELERAGLLVDETGQALNYELGALKFGSKIETEVEKITKAFERFIEQLDLVAQKLMSLPTPDIRLPSGNGGTWPGDDRNTTMPVPYATGGLITRPTLALLGERGPELVTPLSRRYANPTLVPIPNLASGMTSSDPRVWEEPRREDYRSDFREAVAEMREDLKGWLESFADAMAVTMRDAAMGAV